MKTKLTAIFGLFAVTVAALAIFVACSMADGGYAAESPAGGANGSGGSMARFTIVGDHLYTVNSTSLTVVSLTDPATPVKLRSLDLGWDIETIFPMKRDDKQYLFIGSRSAMYIFDATNPAFPEQLTQARHFTSNDPVVAYRNLAFVTLYTTPGSWNGGVNELEIYDISDIRNPFLIRTVGMSMPRGLAVDGENGLLFVCEDGGVSAWSFTYPADGIPLTGENIELRGLYMTGQNPAVGSIDAYDCILMGGNTLLVIGSDGLYQLGYDRERFTLVSKIDLRKEE